MKRYIKYAIILVTMYLASCANFLEEEPMFFVEEASDFFVTEQAADELLNGLYGTLYQCYDHDYIRLFDYTTDIMSVPREPINPLLLSLYDYSFTPAAISFSKFWNMNAYGISRANTIIESVKETDLEKDYMPRVLAEAKFWRAFFYFNQVRAFGPVPLTLKGLTTNEEDQYPKNVSELDIYNQIIQDLIEAEDDLPMWTDLAESQKGKVTSGAAKSLLAWVYLTRASFNTVSGGNTLTPEEYYRLSQKKAEEVILNHGYGLWENYEDVFLPKNENGKEDILSVQYSMGNTYYNTNLNTYMMPNPAPNGGRGFNMAVVNQDFFKEKYAEWDNRRDVLIYEDYYPEGSTILRTINAPYIKKYYDPNSASDTDQGTNFPLIRYAQVLLISAEASLELNETGKALSRLNQVMERANLKPLNIGSNASQIRKALREERGKEFVGEGIRWFDLQRWGILKEELEKYKPEAKVQMPKHKYFPIPQSEIDSNPNLVQNPGYSLSE